jgi:hypothetical protein
LLINAWQSLNFQVVVFIFAIKQRKTMFEFDQYLGFLAFLAILTIGFWLMIFLTGIIPYWITGTLLEKRKLKKEAKKREEESNS